MNFTPDDLKLRYPGKYDSWKFAKNGRGEWFGLGKRQQGILVSKTNKNGETHPYLKMRESDVLGPAIGGVLFGIVKKKKSAPHDPWFDEHQKQLDDKKK